MASFHCNLAEAVTPVLNSLIASAESSYLKKCRQFTKHTIHIDMRCLTDWKALLVQRSILYWWEWISCLVKCKDQDCDKAKMCSCYLGLIDEKVTQVLSKIGGLGRLQHCLLLNWNGQVARIGEKATKNLWHTWQQKPLFEYGLWNHTWAVSKYLTIRWFPLAAAMWRGMERVGQTLKYALCNTSAVKDAPLANKTFTAQPRSSFSGMLIKCYRNIKKYRILWKVT